MTDQDMAARLRLLMDERAIIQTIHRYVHAVDYGHEGDFVDCFTEDGIFDFRVRLEPETVALRGSGTRTPHGAIWRGRGELAQFIANHTRPPGHYHKHVPSAPLIRIDGVEASAETYIFMMIDRDGWRDVLVFGRYLDRFRRCPDGRWRIQHRIADVESRDAAGSKQTVK